MTTVGLTPGGGSLTGSRSYLKDIGITEERIQDWLVNGGRGVGGRTVLREFFGSGSEKVLHLNSKGRQRNKPTVC